MMIMRRHQQHHHYHYHRHYHYPHHRRHSSGNMLGEIISSVIIINAYSLQSTLMSTGCLGVSPAPLSSLLSFLPPLPLLLLHQLGSMLSSRQQQRNYYKWQHTIIIYAAHCQSMQPAHRGQIERRERQTVRERMRE